MSGRRNVGRIERHVIASAWENKCAYCETLNGPFVLDHIVPHSKGGSCKVENLCYCCDRCNQRKAASRLPKTYEGLLLSIAKRKSYRIKIQLKKSKRRWMPKTPQEAVFGAAYVKKYMTKNTVRGNTQAVTQADISRYESGIYAAVSRLRSKQEKHY